MGPEYVWRPRRDGKVAKLAAGQYEALSRLKSMVEPGARYIWIHAASLGEFEQGRPLIEKIKRERPELKVLLTFFSPSGYEVRKNYPEADIVLYLPLDTPGNVRMWLETVKPEAVIFVKYEFWGNYLSELKRRAIPTYIVSAIFRPGQIFFRPWGGPFRKMLGCFNRLFVQDRRSQELLAGVDVENVTVAGDTRFDRVTAIRAKRRDIASVELFKSAHPDAYTLVVGSSWEKDEDVYVPVLKKHDNVCAIIAPHEFDKDRLSAMRRRLGSDSTMLFSDFERLYKEDSKAAAKVASAIRYLIIDCYGLLSSLYRYADIAYVGGGFGVGIHNINEAAVYGIPVIFGPNYAKFNEAVELIALEGAFSVDGGDGFAVLFDRLVSDDRFRSGAGAKAAGYIESKVGATPIIIESIFGIKTS